MALEEVGAEGVLGLEDNVPFTLLHFAVAAACDRWYCWSVSCDFQGALPAVLCLILPFCTVPEFCILALFSERCMLIRE